MWGRRLVKLDRKELIQIKNLFRMMILISLNLINLEVYLFLGIKNRGLIMMKRRKISLECLLKWLQKMMKMNKYRIFKMIIY